jgi:hypothetical protein
MTTSSGGGPDVGVLLIAFGIVIAVAAIVGVAWLVLERRDRDE